MPYAANGHISQSPIIGGGIEITQQQYADALAGMMSGKIVTIDGGFAIVDPPGPEPEPEPEPPTIEEAIAAKLAELDDFRWQVEIGGTEMAGITIRTDPNSQAKVAAAYTMARLDPAYEVPTWEALPGLFIPLSNAQLVAMGEAVRDHVQDTFNRKAVLHAAITALESVEVVEAFDIETEWGNDAR